MNEAFTVLQFSPQKAVIQTLQSLRILAFQLSITRAGAPGVGVRQGILSTKLRLSMATRLKFTASAFAFGGIDAPESSQLCRNGNSDLYRCGAAAANKLFAFTSGKVVNCEPVDRDLYGRTVARCSVNGTDIAEWLVETGLALDWPRYSHGRYGSAEASARRGDKGIWAGTWTLPWEYRACVTAGSHPAAC